MSQSSGARVLVVDDEPAIVRAVQTNLSRHGFEVDAVATGQDALDASLRIHPDLVLLDLGLPDTDGLDVIRAIRQRASTPTVVLSARDAEQSKVAAPPVGIPMPRSEPRVPQQAETSGG